MAPRLTCLFAACALAGALASAVAGELQLAMPQPDAREAFPFGEQAPAPRFDAFYAGMVESLPPAERAGRALELAIDGYAGAADYVLRQAPGWRGQLKQSERLSAMIGVAMNSPRIEARMAGFEVQFALDGIVASPAQVEHFIALLKEDPRGTGPWMLWHLGALGARDVDRERIFGVLVAYSRSDDETLRRWAVEALDLFGGSEAIAPLLEIAATDPSATIRERAFCGLAQSGTFRSDERRLAVPGLFAIATDPRADRQQVDWSYQALREITGIRDLPQQPMAWRERLRRQGLLR